ncbi:DUF1127 domain-containing protein [Bradyrhizobium yuanmingense]|uniref:DUF1127 domain-containing protein n=1 Tax=Bradyrhizobium yuanmingense TaxID=108015 RepID=UPI0023B8A075|nr:DUF1127 domain-containing protein [Bradyrhizobium yuanmingense]MDF0493268.1 DUF1127 domain-containing protein [Bradyrhizobium yuanmingense]
MQARRERSRVRYQLAAMTERELQDFGMSRSEIEHELRKPRCQGRRNYCVPPAFPRLPGAPRPRQPAFSGISCSLWLRTFQRR